MVVWEDLLDRNRRWAAEHKDADPDYFVRAASEHRPRAYFIGCSDARVPVNLLTDTEVGELFIHRNIANQVQSADASLAAGIEYAIDALGVADVIVCGHHGCGGVGAALSVEDGQNLPFHRVEAWIEPVRLLSRLHRAELAPLEMSERVDRLVELNVEQQVHALARHPSVRAAWAAGRDLRLHGWVYHLGSGVLAKHLRIDGPELPEVTAPSSGADAQAK
jgi:carbonic anhydrase